MYITEKKASIVYRSPTVSSLMKDQLGKILVNKHLGR